MPLEVSMKVTLTLTSWSKMNAKKTLYINVWATLSAFCPPCDVHATHVFASFGSKYYWCRCILPRRPTKIPLRNTKILYSCSFSVKIDVAHSSDRRRAKPKQKHNLCNSIVPYKLYLTVRYGHDWLSSTVRFERVCFSSFVGVNCFGSIYWVVGFTIIF